MDDLALADDYIDHQIDLQHYGNGVLRRMVNILRKTEADILSRIDIADVKPGQRARLERMLVQIRNIIARGMSTIETSVAAELRNFSVVETAFYDTALRSASFVGSFDRLTPQVVYSAAMSQPFRGRLLGEWFASLSNSMQTAYSDVIRIGFVEGAGTKTIMARLRRQVGPVNKRHLESITRTAITHLSVSANKHSFEQAEVGYWQFLSILDGRTTAECRGRSNQVYKVRPGAPWPPRHVNCRSSPMGVSSSQGMELPSYTDFLHRQPVSRQDEILGKAKGQLFRKGELPLRRFINRRGRELGLNELEARFPGHWRRAGLQEAA